MPSDEAHPLSIMMKSGRNSVPYKLVVAVRPLNGIGGNSATRYLLLRQPREQKASHTKRQSL